MKLSATLTNDELRSLAYSLVPLRIDLSGGPDKQARWLDIEEILDSELLPEKGFLLATRASIRWPERAMLTEFHVQRVEVIAIPNLTSTPHGAGLSISLRCRDLDIRWVPDFIDRAIVRRINAALTEAGAEFRWDFSETLTFSFDQTAQRSNIAKIGLDLSTAELSVDDTSVHLAGPMQIRIERRAPRELERKQLPALPAKAAAHGEAEGEASDRAKGEPTGKSGS